MILAWGVTTVFGRYSTFYIDGGDGRRIGPRAETRDELIVYLADYLLAHPIEQNGSEGSTRWTASTQNMEPPSACWRISNLEFNMLNVKTIKP